MSKYKVGDMLKVTYSENEYEVIEFSESYYMYMFKNITEGTEPFSMSVMFVDENPDFFLKGTKKPVTTCTCPREVWLYSGCKCGMIEKEREAQDGRRI